MNWYSVQEMASMYEKERRSLYEKERRSPHRPTDVRRDPCDVALVVYTVIMIIVGVLMVLFPAPGVDDSLLLP